jgi:DNA polymerase III subunit delta
MPPLAPAEFFARLGRRQPPLAAVALVGTDAYWRAQCRKKLVEAFVPEGARDWAVARFSAAEASLDGILRQAVTRPMLAPHQVIFVEELEAIERRGEQAREEAVAQLAAYLDDPAPFTLLVLEAQTLDQRTRLAKLLEKRVSVVSLDAHGSPEAGGANLATQFARERGVEIDPEAAALLSELAAGQAARLETEVEKLATYVGARRRITAQDVAELVVATGDYSVWELAEVLGTGARPKALAFLDGLLRAGEAAPQIVGALAWMYRKLLEVQELPAHVSGWDAARRLGMRQETAQVALAQARKIPRQSLRAGLVALAEADNRLKSGKVNDRAVMEFLLAQLTAPPRPRARAPR